MEVTQLSAQEFTLHDYLEVVKRRKWTILQTVAVVAVLGAVSAASTRPMYQAESKLLVQASPYQLNTVDTENVSADYQNGVLKVKLAKRAEAKPKQIKVNVGAAKTIEPKSAGKAA